MINREITTSDSSIDNKQNMDAEITTTNEEEMIVNEEKDNDKKENNRLELVDKNNIDYYKHRGIIDCLEIDECISKSIKIKNKFKNIISNIFYLDVLSKDGISLGYYIDYYYNDYQYGSKEECVNNGILIQEKLKDHNFNYVCLPNGLLKIMEAK